MYSFECIKIIIYPFKLVCIQWQNLVVRGIATQVKLSHGAQSLYRFNKMTNRGDMTCEYTNYKFARDAKHHLTPNSKTVVLL